MTVGRQILKEEHQPLRLREFFKDEKALGHFQDRTQSKKKALENSCGEILLFQKSVSQIVPLNETLSQIARACLEFSSLPVHK